MNYMWIIGESAGGLVPSHQPLSTLPQAPLIFQQIYHWPMRLKVGTCMVEMQISPQLDTGPCVNSQACGGVEGFRIEGKGARQEVYTANCNGGDHIQRVPSRHGSWWSDFPSLFTPFPPENVLKDCL